MRWFEALGVRNSHALVADNVGIQEYLFNAYGVQSRYIPYGVEVVDDLDITLLDSVQATPRQYFLLIARLEPENNIELILDGFVLSGDARKFIVVGNCDRAYGARVKRKYACHSNILFIGSLYHKPTLDSLRNYAELYFHGHSVGGTNPSLLEAMGSGALIAAHDNEFNHAVLGGNGVYFGNRENVCRLIQSCSELDRETFRLNNFIKIQEEYLWSSVVDKYESLFFELKSEN